MNALTRGHLFGRGSRVVVSGVRRAALVLVLALPAATWMIVAAVPDASAASSCSPTSHCWATYDNKNTNTNHGIFGKVEANCLYMPKGNGSFVTNQIWDTSSGGYYWEEAGLYAGVGSNISYGNKNWFWADSRPGGGINEHDSSTTANTNTSYRTKVEYQGNNTWYIYGNGNYSHFGTSTSQSATLITGEAGTEYSAGSGSGIRDVGNVSDLQRKTSSNPWYSWGNNVTPGNVGSGYYITAFWNSSSNQVYWSGPC